MRISEVEVTNFRGVRKAVASSLDDQAIVTISGRNGVGKSLILLAIYLTWHGKLPDNGSPDGVDSLAGKLLIGAWGNAGSITLKVNLSASEWAELVAFGEQTGQTVSGEPHELSFSCTFDKVGGASFTADKTIDAAAAVLRSAGFRDQHPFARVDFIPGERMVQRNDYATFSGDALEVQEQVNLRESVLQSLISQYGPFTLGGVASYLAALDYSAFIATRPPMSKQSISLLQSGSDYDAIASGFATATGKTIGKPEVSADRSIAIFVDAGNGNRHALSQLSSGEQEALGLMYLVRRLAARGGVLLIDEPEQHLHPSLQRSLVALLRQEGEYSQLWLSTHSPGLITAAGIGSILTVSSPAKSVDNQLTQLSNEPERVDLLGDLGVPPSMWQHGDYLLVVEGRSDERMLTGLLPLEMGRALVLVGGSRQAVGRIVEALTGRPGVLPWVAVRDRDLDSDEELSIARSNSPGVQIWPCRAIENLFLTPAWIAAALGRVGPEVSQAKIETRLFELSLGQQVEVARLLTERRLEGIHRPSTESRRDLRAWYEAQAQAFQARAEAYETVSVTVVEEVRTQWSERWVEWSNAKRLLSEYLSGTPFRSLEALIEAMMLVAREDDTFVPEAVKHLRSTLAGL